MLLSIAYQLLPFTIRRPLNGYKPCRQSVFRCLCMLHLCGPTSLVLSTAAWVIAGAFAAFAAKQVMEEINCGHGGDKGFVLFVICTLWCLLWLSEIAFRNIIYKNAWTTVTCGSASLVLLVAWIAGAIITCLLTECALRLLDHT